MMRGADFWDSALTCDMVECDLEGRIVLTYPDLAQSPYHALATTAARTPDATALVDDWGRPTSYGRLVALVDALADYLVGCKGVGRGVQVGLLCHADLEFVVALYAISKAGATCVPFPTKYRKPELVSLMRAAEITLLVAGEEFEAWAGEFPLAADAIVWSHGVEAGYGFEGLASVGACPDPRGLPCDTGIMMFTSGTTHTSKGVLLANYNLCHAAEVYARLMRTTPDEKCLIPVPIYHVTGLVGLLMQFLLVGATVYLHRTFNARRVVETCRAEGITYLHASPTAFAEVLSLRTEYDGIPTLRVVLSGSSYDPVQRMRAFHEWLPNTEYRVVYGLTETAGPALLFPCDTPTSPFAGATGMPVPGLDARICDDDGHDLALGEVGELWLRGACVTRGYYQSDADAITPDGWLKTGDVAYANDKGYVWVVDRKKDMINRGGEKVWCSSLEEVLSEIPGVGTSCVAGIPDDLYGEVPVAAIVAEPGVTLTERGIKDALTNRIARFKIPVHVVFVDKIPTTRGGKPDRAAVRTIVLDSLRHGRD